MSTETKVMPVELARRLHDTYERLAPEYGYETRLDTREFDPESPNGRLMIAVCEEIIAAAPSSEPSALREAALAAAEYLESIGEIRYAAKLRAALEKVK